eukprot:TRINITY_DN12181_c0_g1_i3.p1 TRINITY_DN12181_c0_g1~~TRINITY_DN12181_c0_g1_i3.p1  ORF type:complete len:151 (-),score=42.94 TRINITY_DN12181_c0_g1_i3:280-732(-)
MGNDSEGLPTLCLRGVHHHPGVLDPSKFMRYLVYLVEKGRREWGVGSHYQANMVVDRVDSGLHNQDPELLKVMLPIFRDNYPEIIHRAYIAPSNWVFMLIWAVARVLVDARQRARVQLMGGDFKASLLKFFDEDVLPPHLGGTRGGADFN